ncbi:MAG: ABC transporter ATP-binding protein [Lachnospiraceae bacterium]|nr:ABC transporter ATP-binding protein [Lachnospiraceae bacterium]
MKYLLELENVSKKYKRFSLKDISFSVSPGVITGFVGINGAGKSTTIKIIADLIKKDNGVLRFFGEERKSKYTNELIGYVMDSSYFYEKQTLKSIKNTISGTYRNWNENDYQRYLDLFLLDESQKVEELSKGMKMKYALALALSHNARLLIMDEPTSGLDPLIRSQIISVLKEFIADGTRSVLFSTHITSDLEKVAKNIIFIHDGKIVFNEALSNISSLHKKIIGTDFMTLEDCIIDFIEYMKRGNGI